MKEIARKDLMSTITNQINSDMKMSATSDESFFITHLNGMSIYFTEYRIREFEDGNVMLTFDSEKEVCTCCFSTTLLDYILIGDLSLYKIID